MPRMDNSHKLEFDNSDPGATPPIDLCIDCWASRLEEEEIEHPDYGDGKYYCCGCSTLLTADDNGY